MLSLDPNATPVRANGVEASRFGADFVVLDADGRMLRGLNATGTRVFELIDGKRTLSQIAAAIAQEFAVSQEQALNDVSAFVDTLRNKKLIDFVERPTPEGRGSNT